MNATIVEVAPRDGFQSIRAFIPTYRKIEAIRKLARARFRRIEVGSFVSPRVLPQMADITEIIAEISDLLQTLVGAVLVANCEGAHRAIRAGVPNLAFVVSASESHNKSNVGLTVAQSLQHLRTIIDELGGQISHLRVNIASAFDCPFTGTVSTTSVRSLAEAIATIAPRCEIALCDTTGRAFPTDVASLFRDVSRALTPQVDLAFHSHDTYGLAIANILAASEAGVQIFDAAAAGLGGCPFAPGASGNVASEDAAIALRRAGVSVDLDIAALLEAADYIAEIDPPSNGGHMRIAPRARLLNDLTRLG